MGLHSDCFSDSKNSQFLGKESTSLEKEFTNNEKSETKLKKIFLATQNIAFKNENIRKKVSPFEQKEPDLSEQTKTKLSFGISQILSSPSKYESAQQISKNENSKTINNSSISKPLFKFPKDNESITANLSNLAVAMQYMRAVGVANSHPLPFFKSSAQMNLSQLTKFSLLQTYLPSLIKIPAFRGYENALRLHQHQQCQQKHTKQEIEIPSSQPEQNKEVSVNKLNPKSSVMFPWMHERKDRLISDPLRCKSTTHFV